MKTNYPITQFQERLFRSAKQDLENAQNVLTAFVAMALAGEDIPTGNLVDVTAGEMIVETPDEDTSDNPNRESNMKAMSVPHTPRIE